MKYYPIVKKWAKIKKHLNDTELNDILVEDFNKFTYGRWKQKFKLGMFPRDCESCYWDDGIRGRKPEFWKYVKHSACHWLVNFNLKLAQLVEPKREWRILTSEKHSTVWDGQETLFDFNFLALGVSPNEAYKTANKEELNVNERIEVNFTDPFWKDNPKIKPVDWDERN